MDIPQTLSARVEDALSNGNLLDAPDISRIMGEYRRRNRDIAEDFYSWARPSNFLQHEQVARGFIRLLKESGRFPLRDQRVADIGCGAGTWLLEFLQWDAQQRNLAGIDLMPDRIARAAERLPHADLHQGSAAQLPWPDKTFDIVTQFLMFTSILDAGLKQRVAAEMVRVLKPGGVVLWCDFRVDNPANQHVRGIRAQEIRRLFPGCTMELAPTVLAPPISRRIAHWSWPAAQVLQALPFLCTHYIGLIRKA